MPTDTTSRRTVLKAGAATAIAVLMPKTVSAAPALATKAPVARIEPVTDDYWGTKLTDPYRWMENPKDPDWLPFLKGQNALTRQALDHLPGHAALKKRISALTGDAAQTREVDSAGGLLFYEQRPVGSDNYKLFVQDSDGNVRTLIDPTAMGKGSAHISLDWWQVSWDGASIAYGLSPSGSEASVLHVMRVASGEVLPERIEMTDFGSPSWLPDNSGFFYNQLTGKRGTPSLYADSQARLHRLGTDPKDDPVLLKRGLDPAIVLKELHIPGIVATAGSRTVLAVLHDITPEFAAYSADLGDLLAGKPAWRKICDFDDIITDIAVLEDDLYLLDTKNARRGRLLKSSAAKPDLASAALALPEEQAVMQDLHAARDGILITFEDGGFQRLKKLGRDGQAEEVTLPFPGALGGVYASSDRDGAYLNLTSWLEPSGIWRLSADGSVTDTGLNPKPPIDLSPYETKRGFAIAGDGTRIPYSLIQRKGAPRNGNCPTLMTAYGAYQYSFNPKFAPQILAFLDEGGVYVVGHVRGGGEYGRDWHKGGQKATKPNTWRDLIAVCQTLFMDRVTSPSHLAILGTSAGGITVGKALTERPDMFAAVIDNVGWTNPLRYVAEQNIADIEEWGPMVDADSFRIMHEMDAYQSVKDGTKYPAVLCVTGATDPRVAPWHVAKFAARLQVASASHKPVLLRVDFDAGHGIGSTRAQSDALAADMYAFVLWQTGVKEFQPKKA
jgi:prolyl oligopeptidase